MDKSHFSLPTVRIREVAAITGISASTIRKYERLGLVLPYVDRSGGHRLFSQEDMEWLSELHQFFKREGMKPLQASHILARMPTLQQRTLSGYADCGVVPDLDKPCWTKNLSCPDWRQTCRTCPALSMRRRLLTVSSDGLAALHAPSLVHVVRDLTSTAAAVPLAERVYHALGFAASFVVIRTGHGDSALDTAYPEFAASIPSPPHQSGRLGEGTATSAIDMTAGYAAPPMPADAGELRDMLYMPIPLDGVYGAHALIGMKDTGWQRSHAALFAVVQHLVTTQLTVSLERDRARFAILDLSNRLGRIVFDARSPLAALALRLDIVKHFSADNALTPPLKRQLSEAKRIIHRLRVQLDTAVENSPTVGPDRPLNE